MSDPMRLLPLVTPETEAYWTGGQDGRLVLPRCDACDTVLHPSMATCPDCPGATLTGHSVAGTGVIVGFSVNHQFWMPYPEPPYVVAIVELDSAPGVRITTNIVDVDPEAVHVGMVVRVTFETNGDVWIPLFTPTGEQDHPICVPEPVVNVRPPAIDKRYEDRCVISGIGMSDVGRRLMRPPISLAVDAALAAIADAGLTPADIDGLSSYPGALGRGMSEGGIAPLEEALRLQPTWFNAGLDLPGQGGAVIAGMLAVAAGLCRHVLCVRTVWEATYTELIRTGRMDIGGLGRAEGDMQWRLPYGAASAATWIGMAASQYFDKYGANRDVLGRLAINARAGAATNPEAVYKEPITLDDYYAARMISTPFGLYDCDVPCDGAVAIVISAADHALDCEAPVNVRAVGTQITERVSWDQGTITHEPMVAGPAAHMWSRTDLSAHDVDVALLYDGFTFNCVSWLEALGFCGPGEATDYIGDGTRISLTGELPLNPHGGQLSAGRLHGFGFLREAVLQLRGTAGARQVNDAAVAVASTGGGQPGSCFLLTRA